MCFAFIIKEINLALNIKVKVISFYSIKIVFSFGTKHFLDYVNTNTNNSRSSYETTFDVNFVSENTKYNINFFNEKHTKFCFF